MTNGDIFLRLTDDATRTLGYILACAVAYRVCEAVEKVFKLKYSVDYLQNKAVSSVLTFAAEDPEALNRPAGAHNESVTASAPTPAQPVDESVASMPEYTPISNRVLNWFAKGDTGWFAMKEELPMKHDINIMRDITIGAMFFKKASLHKITQDEYESNLTTDDRISLRQLIQRKGATPEWNFYRLETID